MAHQTDGSLQIKKYLARHMPIAHANSRGPEGAIIPDAIEEIADKIAVVYDRGNAPPNITITNVSGHVQTVHADGIAIAVVASAAGPRLTEEDVVLVERFVSA